MSARVAVFKFASCDGCQLSVLDAEDELLAIVGAVDIVEFPEARTLREPGPYDVGFVEGSITTPHDAARIRQVRESCRTLVTIGACATSGGIQALRNMADVGGYSSLVYAHPEYLDILAKSTPISDHVVVDLELGGNSEKDCYGDDCDTSSLTVIGAGIRRQLHRTKRFAASAGLKVGVAQDSTSDGESGELYLLQIPFEAGVRARSRKKRKSMYLGRPRTSLGGHAYVGIQPFVGFQNLNGDSRGVLGLNFPHVGLGCQLSWFYLNVETYLSFISSPVSDIRPGGSMSFGVMWD